MNLVEHVYVHVELVSELHVLSDIRIKSIFILHVQIAIPLDTSKLHLLKTFFQPEVGEMEIDKMPTQIRVQNLLIVGWIVTKEEQLTNINLGSEENLQKIKINVDLEPIISYQLIELLKEFKDIFAWIYKYLKGMPSKITQHQIELDTLIPPIHQARYQLNPNYVVIVK